jgi:hypothetical protein
MSEKAELSASKRWCLLWTTATATGAPGTTITGLPGMATATAGLLGTTAATATAGAPEQTCVLPLSPSLKWFVMQCKMKFFRPRTFYENDSLPLGRQPQRVPSWV